jgi:ribosomal protein S12 methylthiotransferase
LKRMRRQITIEETKAVIEEARQRVPGIAFRTTFLVGYPGETEEEFQELVDFVKEMRFERLGVFQYSHEENTIAHDEENNIPAELKEQRAAILMNTQQEISLELNQRHIGNTYKVLFDRVEGEYFVGRTEFDSPEVDNEVLVPTKGNYVRIGDFAMVKIEDATEYDLFGTLPKA